MKKKSWYYLGAAILAIAGIVLYFALPASVPEGTYENLIENGSFELLDSQGMPEGWYTESYAGAGYTLFQVSDGMEGAGVSIENLGPNDARFAQTVSVSPDTLYHLHGYIQSSADGGRGANLSIEGLYAFSSSLYDTQGEWQEVSLYGRTGKNQHTVTVFARLGGYSGEATGTACFDQITLNRVDSIPAGFNEVPWYSEVVQAPAEDKGQSTSAALLILLSLLYCGLFFLTFSYLRKDKELLQPRAAISHRSLWILGGIVAAGGILRLIIAAIIPGYGVDMGCFTGWGAQFTQTGPANFYQFYENIGGHCDYPPGYILILGAMGYIGKIFGGLSNLLVKMPPILSDLALCILIFTEGRKHLSEKAALALSFLYAFNPLVLATGAAWGQADAVLTLMIVLTVLFALKGQWKIALPVYVVSILVKPQALMFGPLGLTAFILHILKSWKDKKLRKAVLTDAAIGLGIALAAFLAIILPFSVNRDGLSWLITLYSKTMVQYNYVTLNACNIYFLLEKNFVSVDGNISGDAVMILIVYLLSVLPLAAAYLMDQTDIRKKWQDREEKIRLLILGGLAVSLGLILLILALLGMLTYSLLGSLMIGYAVLLMSALYVLGKDQKNLPLLGAAMLLMLYCTGSMMHERYLFPCIALMWLSYFLKKDKRILYLALAVTVTGFLNVGCVLDRNIRIGNVFEAHLDMPAWNVDSDMGWMEYLLSGINCLLCGLSLMLSCLLTQKNALIRPLEEKKQESASQPVHLPKRLAPRHENRPLPRLKKRDYIIMLGVTALYAVLAFTNLGSTKAPQNGWVSRSPEEQITVDLGEEKQFNLYYYGGIHHYDSPFTIEISRDGNTWSNRFTAGMPIGDCFKWKVLGEYESSPYPANITGQYVRITADHYGLTLFEVLLRDSLTGESLQPAAISSTHPENNPSSLFDEPDTMEGMPGWFNSFYFDEIYHARTGYEHLHGLQPYETTHPPLGKVLISWCIAIFGMTPFGWRFAGALAGVLMLPGMYLLGHLLIRKKWGGAAAMGLMALDLMHFTQTRIATIDSFVVLFIIWEFYFMLRWFYLDYFKTPFWKTFIPLILCGLCMGFSIASKWTGCYAAVGLALILFFGVWRRYREILWAKEITPKKRTPEEKIAADQGLSRLLITLLSCFVIFIFVPLLIYYLSYIPYFAPSGGVTVEKVIQAAVGDYFQSGTVGGMLGYHGQSGFGADHPFHTPWYQWPIIAKPMFYAYSSYEKPGMQSALWVMGNPAVWWTGLISLFGVIYLWAKRHFRKDYTIALHAEEDDPRFALLLISFAVQYLPWVLVTRGTYIYHYFPSVPFIILCTVFCLDRIGSLGDKWEKTADILMYVLLGIAALLFIGFFPYASGVEAPQAWMDAMRWFDGWLYY